MAQAGFIHVEVTDYNRLTFSWEQVSQSTINNTTTISWNLTLSSTVYGYISSSASKQWTVRIGGETYTGWNNVGIGYNTTKTLVSGQTTLTHGSDGTRSFDVYFSQQFDIDFGGVHIGTKTGSGTYSLNTITAAKTLTLGATSVEIGKQLYVSVKHASSDETYDVAYSFAGQDYVDIKTGLTIGNSDFVWTVPSSLAELIPDALSGVISLRCTTKQRDGTLRGIKVVNLTATVPEYWPSIDLVTFVEANASVAASGVGAFVQNASKLKVNITASGVYGSTIKSIKSEFQGKTYTGASWTSSTIEQAGEHSIQVTITDSRGRTQSGPKKLSVIDYRPPSIDTFKAARYNTSGVQDEDGTRVRATIAYTIFSLDGKNKADLRLDYKRKDATSWTKLWEVTGHTSGATTAMPTTDVSTDYQYDLRLTLTDKAGGKAVYAALIPSGAVILDLKANGKGVAFFKTAEQDGVDIPGQLPSSPIMLSPNSNLDDLTTPGYYVAPTTAVAATIAGRPQSELSLFDKPFSVEVRHVGTTGCIYQTLYTHLEGIWERVSEANAAGDLVLGSWVCAYRGESYKTLWAGNEQMGANRVAELYRPISHQVNGIVLIFSRYIANSSAQNYLFSCHYVPKILPRLADNLTTGAATVFNMATTKFDYISSKYLYITDTVIKGHADNTASGTTNGITYNNGQFALRYVIGV